MAITTLSVNEIKDWPSYHAISAKAFGFPSFYGCNINAWIDCLSYLTEDTGMSKFILAEDEQLTIHVPGFEDFARTHSDIASAFLESVAAVNLRYIEQAEMPRLVLVLA